jgi:hypothetical protein
MDDAQIVDLYWRRDEAAIGESDKKYGRYLTKIAFQVLADFEDTKECVNDTYLKAWNSMPPHKPGILSTYLAHGSYYYATDFNVYRCTAGQRERLISSFNVRDWVVDEHGLYFTRGRSLYAREHETGAQRVLYTADTSDNRVNIIHFGNGLITVSPVNRELYDATDAATDGTWLFTTAPWGGRTDCWKLVNDGAGKLIGLQLWEADI